MKSKIVLFTSIFVSVFFLLAVVGIVSATQANNSSMNSAVQASSFVDSGNSALQAADLPQQYATREAAYQNLIAQANQRIETLNNEVSSLQQKNNQTTSQATITADKAAQIAMNAAGGNETLQKMPELINYQGTTAFEVKLGNGLVYVDALSGKVLFNGVTPRITSQRAGEIAGQYLGGMDPQYAAIKLVNLNGTQIYQVTFSGDKVYVVFIDLSGQVLKAQIYDYAGNGGNTPSISSNGVRDGNDD
jgi:uncharacterized membrane protein YkoI